MIEILKNLIHNTTFLTVISGVLVYILSQIILEFIINPIKQYKILKQKIIYNITLYCCYYTNPYNLLKDNNISSKEQYEIGSREIRKIGAELSGYIGVLPKMLKKTRESLDNVLHALIGISNGFYIVTDKIDIIEENMKCEELIKKEFKIK